LRLPLRLAAVGLLLAAFRSLAQQPDTYPTTPPAQQTTAPAAAPTAEQAPAAQPTPAPAPLAEQKAAPPIPLIQQQPLQQHFFDKPADLSFTFTQERTKFVGASTNDYFRLRGASIDYAYTLWHGIGFVVGGTGLATTNLGGSLDIHEVAFLGGMRYTYNYGHITPTAWGRNAGIFIEGKVGYTFASAGLYPVGSGTTLNNTAAGLTYEGGGGVNIHIYHRFDLRLGEADYLITQLPNGTNNQQVTLRLATGINFHFGN